MTSNLPTVFSKRDLSVHQKIYTDNHNKKMMIIINIKEILRKSIKQKSVENGIVEQSRVGKYFNQNCKDPVIAPIRIRYLRVRKTS